nr:MULTISPECIES: HGGxSTG domain-containing protein [unclassified Haematobacter]
MAQVRACQVRVVSGPPKARTTSQPRCGARTRKGTSCACKPQPGKARCKFHGGLSTGARTPEGLDRIRDAQRQRWIRWRRDKAELGGVEPLPGST